MKINKKILLFQAPIQSVSGYGAHSRDIFRSFKKILDEDE